jgi:hypothetical protein
MIWIWLRDLLFLLARFVIPPPSGTRTSIDPKEPCPACGGIQSKLEFQRVLLQDSDDYAMAQCSQCGSTSLAKTGQSIHCNQCSHEVVSTGVHFAAMVRKTCAICGFAHFVEPVAAPKYPAV